MSEPWNVLLMTLVRNSASAPVDSLDGRAYDALTPLEAPLKMLFVTCTFVTERHYIQPSLFYVRQRQMRENLEAVPEPSKRTGHQARTRREEDLAGKQVRFQLNRLV